MTDIFTILIADRNPNVREFLGREFRAEGYRVLVARDGKEVLTLLDADKGPDVLILDLNIPKVHGVKVLEWLKGQDSLMPVIVHTYHTEYANHPAVREAAAFFVKTGNNIDVLKSATASVLREWYPERFEGLEKGRRVLAKGHSPKDKNQRLRH